jgi:hypothetical protein
MTMNRTWRKLLWSPTPWKTARSKESERISRDRQESQFYGVEFSTCESNWTPSIVARGNDQTVYSMDQTCQHSLKTLGLRNYSWSLLLQPLFNKENSNGH